MSLLFCRLRLAVCLLLASHCAIAQTASGTITGNVLDAQQSLIAGVEVTITHVEQGISRRVIANERGLYEAKFLSVGSYRVSVTHPGFKKFEASNLVLNVGDTMRVDVTLEVGNVSEAVEVTSSSGQSLKLDTSEVSQVITHTQVANLPLNGRNFDDLIPLNAGVTTGGQGNSNSGYNLNGSRTDQNMFLIEGIDNINFQNNLIIRPPIDAIEEFRILTRDILS